MCESAQFWTSAVYITVIGLWCVSSLRKNLLPPPSGQFNSVQILYNCEPFRSCVPPHGCLISTAASYAGSSASNLELKMGCRGSLWFPLVCPRKCRESTWNEATTASFHLFQSFTNRFWRYRLTASLNKLQVNDPRYRLAGCCIPWVIDGNIEEGDSRFLRNVGFCVHCVTSETTLTLLLSSRENSRSDVNK